MPARSTTRSSSRAIDIIYLAYLEKQVDPELLKKMTALANAVEKKFSTFRAKVDGKEMDDKAVRNVLKTSNSSEQRQAVYEASKEVGKVVEPELLQLVKLRNEAARKLGFKNYHALQLYLNEQDGNELIQLFDKLDDLTREPFKDAKAEIDAKLAATCSIKPAELMPWHYHDPFFQEAPNVFSANLDEHLRQPGPGPAVPRISTAASTCRSTASSRRPAISPRTRARTRTPSASTSPATAATSASWPTSCQDEYWMSTMLHEFGHSVYSSINIPEKLPYVLRMESHILTTEGVAMMFERLSKRRAWLEKMGVKVDDPKSFDETGIQDSAGTAADFLALVPGDAALREGHV